MSDALETAAEWLGTMAGRVIAGRDTPAQATLAYWSHPSLLPAQRNLYFEDLVHAVRARNDFYDDSKFSDTTEDERHAAVDAALWPLLFGLPAWMRCNGCAKRGRAIAYNGLRRGIFGVCPRCEDEGDAAAMRDVEAGR